MYKPQTVTLGDWLLPCRTTIQQNKDLQESNTELKNLLLTQKAENDELKTVCTFSFVARDLVT